MDLYVIGLAVHPPKPRIEDKRLEEVVFDVTRAALDDAGLEQGEVGQVTIAGCDELDGRSISSMLLAMPSGAYLKDETKCTDAGLMAFCLAAMRAEAGFGDPSLVVSWNKNSTAPFDNVMSMRADPFFVRPIGMNSVVADGLFATAQLTQGVTEDEAADWVVHYQTRAARNPRGLSLAISSAAEIAGSPCLATPLRRGHCASLSDGAAAIVLASGRWLASRPNVRPLARVAGLGWRTDQYQLGGRRLADMAAFRGAFRDALARAGRDMIAIDAVELDSQTGFHAAAYARALEGLPADRIAPSGGPFAQNPYFCTGLVHAAEATLQVSAKAGRTQIQGARLAAAHSAHGFAQQGHVTVLLESC
jgi:acetyl-CoA acetyltransferase